MIPDIERIVAVYLRNHPDITPTRVVVETPDDTGTAWIRVLKLDGRQTDLADHNTDFMVQLDIYAGSGTRSDPDENGKTGGVPEVNDLARRVRSALKDMRLAEHAGAVVTRTLVIGDARLPDDDFKPVRERVQLTVEVWAHPTPVPA